MRNIESFNKTNKALQVIQGRVIELYRELDQKKKDLKMGYSSDIDIKLVAQRIAENERIYKSVSGEKPLRYLN